MQRSEQISEQALRLTSALGRLLTSASCRWCCDVAAVLLLVSCRKPIYNGSGRTHYSVQVSGILCRFVARGTGTIVCRNVVIADTRIVRVNKINFYFHPLADKYYFHEQMSENGLQLAKFQE